MAVVCTIGFDQYFFAILGVCMQRWLHDGEFAVLADIASQVKCFDGGHKIRSALMHANGEM